MSSAGRTAIRVFVIKFRLGREGALLREDPQNDILIVVSKSTAKNIDPARMFGIVVDPDTHPDRAVAFDLQIGQRHAGHLHAINKAALAIDPPGFQLAVLRPGQLPPFRRINPALVTKIPLRSPACDFDAVDLHRDVRRPVGAGAGDFRAQFKRELDFIRLAVLQLGVVGELVWVRLKPRVDGIQNLNKDKINYKNCVICVGVSRKRMSIVECM